MKVLENFLDTRMKERTKTLESKLTKLAENEVRKITTIMHELKQSILDELDSSKNEQLLLQLDDDPLGKQQRELDVRALQFRLKSIPEEITNETKSIQIRFSNPTPKLFPVAVNWIFPNHWQA